MAGSDVVAGSEGGAEAKAAALAVVDPAEPGLAADGAPLQAASVRATSAAGGRRRRADVRTKGRDSPRRVGFPAARTQAPAGP